jgi:ABC-type glucose/galactose transport system permease subunit
MILWKIWELPIHNNNGGLYMILKIFVSLIIIFSFLKTLFYGIYEINNNKNKSSGVTIIILGIIGLILPIVIIFMY